MENIEVVVQSLPYLLQGTLVTLRIVALALALGLCMGLPLAIGASGIWFCLHAENGKSLRMDF